MNLDMFSCEEEQDTRLSVLSFGAGQDSTALLYKYVYDPDFKMRYAPNDFLVVFADTGNEFQQTYSHLEYVKGFCQMHGIEFVHLTPDIWVTTPAIGKVLNTFLQLRMQLQVKRSPKYAPKDSKLIQSIGFWKIFLQNDMV